MELKDLVVKTNAEEVSKILDINSSIKDVQVWNSFYGGNDAYEKMANDVTEMLLDDGIALIIENDPMKLFKKIYEVTNYEQGIDYIYEFNKNCINEQKMNEYYGDVMDQHLYKSYITEQLQLNASGEFKQEKIDTLGFGETQKKIDEAEEKYNKGEINLGQKYKEIFGDSFEYDNDKVIAMVKEIVDNNYDFESMVDRLSEEKFNEVEMNTLSEILRKEYPDVQDRLNSTLDESINKNKKEINKAIKEEKEKIEKLADSNWYYNISFDEFDNPSVKFIPVEYFDNNKEYEYPLPEKICNYVADLNICIVESNNILKFDSSKLMAKPKERQIRWTLDNIDNLIYNENI